VLKEFYPSIELLVVDNDSNSNDKNSLTIHIQPHQLILNDKNNGYAGGNNIGVKKAIENGCEYVWILNPDIRIDKNTLPLLIETLKADENIAAVGPRICFRNEPSKIYSDGGIIHKERGFETLHKNTNKYNYEIENQPEILQVDYVNGSTFLARTNVFKTIGLMLEDFFLYFEETEWCLRATKNNYKLLVNTNALAYHTSSKKGKLYSYYMTRNRILLAKHQNEFYKKTIKIVGEKIVKKWKHDLKNIRITATTLSVTKGFLSGIFGKLKK
jgi:hypothetical protein